MNSPPSPHKATEENISKLKGKLRELFQMDRGDLDFGLYRIMAHKRAEVDAFLREHLLPQVTQALGDIAQSDISTLQAGADSLAEMLRKARVDPEISPQFQELNEAIKAAKRDQQTEADTYNHLYNFFSRYYDEGDFMSLRRYKSKGGESYSIPYNGEEVKLHWANSDQYYIKTTENYAAYIFTIGDGKQKRRVRLEIAAADNEKDNIKEVNGKQRFFVLAKDFITAGAKELIIRFDHRPLTDGEKKKHPQNGIKRQASINAETEQRIRAKLASDWLNPLSAPCPTEADETRTLLGKHITAYTAKNSFDYFIHKDLDGFLRRELDTYLKSEVISIDNLELADDPRVFIRGLAQIRAIKYVGEKIITFLAQLENFQKQLWLKKKFVLETQYCVTLDKVPKSLYPEIATNKSQHNEWVKLFAIDEMNGGSVGNSTAYSKPLKPKFLKENPYLVLDTRHFNKEFTDKLLAALSEAGSIEEQMNGLLVHGENFQALSLLQERYQGKVQCVYIDPPYNTDSSAILYKNGYKDSSWLSLMEDRLLLAKDILAESGILCCAIDDEEAWRLRALMQDIFEHEVGITPVRSNPVSRKSTGQFSPTHEYAYFFSASEKVNPGHLEKTAKQLKRYPYEDKEGAFAWLNFIRSGTNDRREDRPKLFYPIFVDINDNMRIPQMDWDESKNEYKILEKTKQNEIAIWPIRNNIEKNWQRGWQRVLDNPSEYRIRRNGEGVSIDFKVRMDEIASPSSWWDSKEYASSNHGVGTLKKLFADKTFDFAKAPQLVEDSVRSSGGGINKSVILDFFAGSGTTGHAVVNINRKDNGDRKYILVELGHHFEDVLLPRMKKVVYSKEWKDGKPEDRDGISQLFQYVRLESYEDALDSLTVNTRDDLFDNEDYQLRYALGDETKESATLLGKDFFDPYNYTLSVVRDGVRRDMKTDLAETFNLLLGLRVTGHRKIDDVLVINGINPKRQNCLILWRNSKKMRVPKLDEWFAKHRKTLGVDLDLIYVNGDHTLNALRQSGDKWEAVTIEPVFKKLMFEENLYE